MTVEDCSHWPTPGNSTSNSTNNPHTWHPRPNDSSLLQRLTSSNETEYCSVLDYTRAYTDFYTYYNAYIFPVIALVGLVGNFLNLAVFSSRKMRCKTNYFLASMAMADALFFLTMYLTTLDAYPTLRYSKTFRRLQFHTIIPLMGLLNWFSAASIWLAVGVSVERAVAVKFPLHTNLYWTKSRIISSIVSIFLLTFLLNSYHYYTKLLFVYPLCNECGSYVYRLYTVLPTTHPLRHILSSVSTILCSIVVIILPFILTTILNVVLVLFLHKHERESEQVLQQERRLSGTPRSRRSTQPTQSHERKVTITVSIIIACFLVCNSASAIYAFWDVTNKFNRETPKRLPAYFADISNTLVSVGKMLNFLLYCISSSRFRSQLASIVGLRKGQLSARFHHADNSVLQSEKRGSCASTLSQNGEKKPILPPPRSRVNGVLSVETRTQITEEIKPHETDVFI